MRPPILARLLFAALVAGATVATLGGCFRSRAADGRTTIRFTYYGTVDDLEAWDVLSKRFDAENPDLHLKLSTSPDRLTTPS